MRRRRRGERNRQKQKQYHVIGRRRKRRKSDRRQKGAAATPSFLSCQEINSRATFDSIVRIFVPFHHHFPLGRVRGKKIFWRRRRAFFHSPQKLLLLFLYHSTTSMFHSSVGGWVVGWVSVSALSENKTEAEGENDSGDERREETTARGGGEEKKMSSKAPAVVPSSSSSSLPSFLLLWCHQRDSINLTLPVPDQACTLCRRYIFKRNNLFNTS